MKRIICVLLIIVIICGIVNLSVCEEQGIDLSAYTLDELKILQSQISAEIGERLKQEQVSKEVLTSPMSSKLNSIEGHTLRELFPCENLAEYLREKLAMISIDQKLKEGKLDSITRLLSYDLPKGEYDSLEGIQYLKNLVTIDLQDWSGRDFSKINHLPEGFYDLTELEWLNLSTTSIHDIDWDRVFRFPKLHRLFIFGEDIVEIPDSIGLAHNLKYLFIRHTSITDLPDSISALNNLVGLSIGWCYNMAVFPDVILKLYKLKSLTFFNVPISFIPDDISSMSNLKSLELSYTNITILPESLYKLDLEKFEFIERK